MIGPRGYNLAGLDSRANEGDAPYRIITADCSAPREIDDGLFVTPLPAATETYRVGVCVADTSRLFDDGTILQQAMTRTSARYWTMPSGEQAYEPMIDTDAIRRLELTEGQKRSAMIVSFVVGDIEPPGQVEVSFGEVDVAKNMSYREFGERSRSDPGFRRFGRAGAFIASHLAYNPGGDDERKSQAAGQDVEQTYRTMMRGPAKDKWSRGAKLNEAFMVAANHLVGKQLEEEKKPAIYRVHDPADDSYREFMPTNVARFTATPGHHAGLDLDPFCRVTSPLRRLEDFVMNRQLHQRAEHKPVTQKDHRDVAAAIQRLNQQVIAEISRGPLRLSTKDTLGYGSRCDTSDEPGYPLSLVVPDTETA